jgi:imidazolonepropionase-like amidohydrolase
MKTVGRYALFVMLFALTAGALAAQESKPLAITHAVLIDGNGKAPVENATVLIRDGKIVAAGPAAGIVIPKDAALIDAVGKTVMPGLADMHVHLMGGWDGISTDVLGYRQFLNALLYAGVTTVLDTGNVEPFILQLRQEIARGRLQGPRIYCAGPLIDSADPAWPGISVAVCSVDQIPRIVDQLKKDGVDMLKAYVGLSDAQISALVAAGQKQSLRVVSDPGTRNGSMDVLRTGIAALAHMPPIPLGDEAVSWMKEKPIHCLTTLAVYESFSRRRIVDPGLYGISLYRDTAPPWFVDDLKKEAARALTEDEQKDVKRSTKLFKEAQRNALKLMQAGVLVAAGTDAPYPGDPLGEAIHREMELLVEAGFTPLEAITAATKNAALFMNAAAEWGTVEPGKTADLLIIGGRPDRTIGDTRKIEVLIKSGKIIDRKKLRFDANPDAGFQVFSPSGWKE